MIHWHNDGEAHPLGRITVRLTLSDFVFTVTKLYPACMVAVERRFRIRWRLPSGQFSFKIRRTKATYNAVAQYLLERGYVVFHRTDWEDNRPWGCGVRPVNIEGGNCRYEEY